MNNPSIPAAATDWQGAMVSMLMPLLVAAGFVYLALQPQWEESDTWVTGLFVLIPFEFVRAIVFRILRDTYNDYRNPRHAVRWFLVSILILAAICLVFALFEVGIRAVFVALVDPRTWRLITPPAAIIVIDGIISLYFFRGDAHREAARLDAIADDAGDWIQLFVYPLPILLLACAFLVASGVIPARILRPDWETLRIACLLLAAFYFLGKAILLAYVHTALFNRTGKRLLARKWLQVLAGRKWSRLEADAKAEARSAEQRKKTLAVDAAAPVEDPS